MPKFVNPHDINFFKHISEEWVDTIVETIVTLYKINPYASNEKYTNLYGETVGKTYYRPVPLTAVINREPTTYEYEGFGPHSQQTIEVKFNKHKIRSEMEGVNWISNNESGSVTHIQADDYGYPQIGDILGFDNNYYELTAVTEDNVIGGNRNLYGSGSDISEIETDARITIKCTAVLTSRTNINIDERTL